MLKFVSKALLPLVMDKRARQRLKERREAGKGGAENAAGKDDAPPERGREMTPEREELIRHAREVHRSKAKLLDGLSEEQRQRLYEIALKQFRLAYNKEDDR